MKTIKKIPFETALGYITYLRTYARRKKEDDINSTIENWDETISRVVKSTDTQLHIGFSNKEKKEVYDMLYNLKCSVSGRFLWQLGTATIDKIGLMSLQSCAYITVREPVEPFTWVMNFLMLGSGCGFTLLEENLVNIPVIKKVNIIRIDSKDADYIVPDSREGWVKLLGKVLKAHFYSGKGFTYSCILLRSKGAPIKKFGGVASGPEMLCRGLSNISDLLNKREGLKLRPIDALDIMNHIGGIVVSGNVRRSAQIALGDCKDDLFLRAKRWDLGNIPNSRCYSNNSIICNNINDILVNNEFWEGYQGKGEPYGLINLNLMKKCGRLGETQYSDPRVEGVNPCAEQTLETYESCVTGDTLIHTKKGLYQIKDLVDQEVEIFNGVEWSKVKPFMSKKEDVFTQIGFNDGSILKVNKDHEFSISYINSSSKYHKVKTHELKVGMLLPTFNMKNIEGTSELISGDNKYFSTIEEARKIQILLRRYGINNTVVDKIRYGGARISLLKYKRLISPTIISIQTLDKIEPSYCFNEPKRNMGVFNNVLTYQCCLSEIYLPKNNSKEELIKNAKYLYRICKHSLNLKCSDSKRTEEVVHRNMRMGIGITGYLQSSKEQKSWLDDCYKALRKYDEEYSKEKGFPLSIKLTTVKPSGTLSLLGNCTPGVHPGYSRYYIRRVRISSSSPLVNLVENCGYPVEYVINFDGTYDHNTKIISFPIKLSDETIIAKDCSAVKQMEFVKELQTYWSDNSVSCTVYYRKEELKEIKEWLRINYNDNIKSISFLLHSDHGFKQAPYEEITKEKYEDLMNKCKEIKSLDGICYEQDDQKYIGEGDCVTGTCPIK